ncbi:MAG: hypothetical protein ACK504_09820 [Bacteroidota bacterium]|jgi:hypothetical protein
MASLKYIFFLFLFALLGFSREFIFVNINNLLFKIYYHNDSIIIPDSLSFLSNYNYSFIYYLKYLLTFLYYILYFLISFYAVKIICNNKSITHYIVYIYAILLLLASFIMAYNYIINRSLVGDEYTLSRWLMGIAQSPLVAFFTIATSVLYNNIYLKKH